MQAVDIKRAAGSNRHLRYGHDAAFRRGVRARLQDGKLKDIQIHLPSNQKSLVIR